MPAKTKAKPKAKPTPKAKAPAKPKAAAPVVEAKPVVFAPKKSTPVKPPPRPTAPPAPARPPVPVAPPTPAVDHAGRIPALWARLEAWVATIGAPPLLLAAPATEKDLKAAEKELGRPFPADVRASLRLHDGQAAGKAVTFPWLPGCPPMYSVEAIVAEHKKLSRAPKPKADTCDATNRVRSGARPARIPIADGTYLDFDPGPAGTAGQLITAVTKTDFVVIDVSLSAALERWVTVLERGIWIHDAATNTVRPRALAAPVSNPAALFSKRAS